MLARDRTIGGQRVEQLRGEMFDVEGRITAHGFLPFVQRDLEPPRTPSHSELLAERQERPAAHPRSASTYIEECQTIRAKRPSADVTLARLVSARSTRGASRLEASESVTWLGVVRGIERIS
jgi:hypothetical protein